MAGRLWVAAVLAVAGLVAAPCAGGPGRAQAAPAFAPVDRPGPALSVPEAVLAESVECTANAAAA
ncbi:MAG TPA: lipase, partial [Candidatus Dormibacteraeota bacterium]